MKAFNSLKNCTFKLLTSLVLIGSSSQLGAQTTATTELRSLYRTANSHIQQDRLDEARQLLPKLRHYPLYPWLEYELLLKNFAQSSDASLHDFTQRYPHSLMSDGIYTRWANRLASIRDWHMLLQYIPDNTEITAVQCYRAEALMAIGELETGVTAGKRIWSDATRNLPSDCNGLIRRLQAENALTQQDYWDKIAKLIPLNQVTAARQVATFLPEGEQALVERWINVRSNPNKGVTDALKAPESDRLRDIIVNGIQLSADKKLQDALPLWEQAQKTFSFTPAQKGAVESQLGMWEAWRHSKDGLKRLKAIPVEHRTVEGNTWLARIALRMGEWDTVLEAINALKEQDYNQNEADIWRYWKARALEQTGQKTEAQIIYRQLAEDATFYGFLAADQIKQAYPRLVEPPPDRTQRLQGLQQLAAIARWQEWLELGDNARARREWFRLLQAMDKEGVQTAAAYAIKHNDPNLAIWTISRTRDWNSVDVRFPILYEDLVLEYSRSHEVHPAWIFGVMRRESAFDASAESSAKALGLMQLMPATARELGQRLGVPIQGRTDILQPANNVRLGSAYLRDMLGRFKGNYAQATAAYNAGPGRIPRWAPDETIEADRWVETIPFKETRQYVRAVMAYTTIYDHKLNSGEAEPLSQRLAPIAP